MRVVATAFLVFAFLAPAAGGDPSDLTGGVFIAHEVPYYGCVDARPDPPPGGWCAYYDQYAIHSAEEQDNRIDAGPWEPVLWYVLCAWSEEKDWCGAEFGLGQYDPLVYMIWEFTPCFPASGGLEIPTPGWPGPGEGTALAVTGESWQGNYAPIYFFGGYVYGYYGYVTQVPLAVDPATGFAGWANCSMPPQLYEPVCLGAMGINEPGLYCAPEEPEAVCCIGAECRITTQADCATAGGAWHPEWLTCTPNPCDPTPASRSTWGAVKSIYR